MKTITLTQPWSQLVSLGAKKIETRSWSSPYRGELAIHAAKAFPGWARDCVYEPPFREALAPYFASVATSLRRLEDYLPLGCVLATCRLANVLPTEVLDNENNVFSVSLEPLSEQERVFGDYSPGRFAWILEDVKLFPEPIPAKGALGLWEWIPPSSALASLRTTPVEHGSTQEDR